jgi:hypothetical protein
MKHTAKTALTAAILTAAVSLTACNGDDSGYATVYGPPSAYEPETEVQEDVYGPPPVMEEETDPPETTTVIDIKPAETSATTVEKRFQTVYGPPSDID